jgi:hypothetical protein
MITRLALLLALIVAWPGTPPGPIYLDATTVDPPIEQATVAVPRTDTLPRHEAELPPIAVVALAPIAAEVAPPPPDVAAPPPRPPRRSPAPARAPPCWL